VLEQGHGSRDNLQALTEAPCAFLAALPARWGRRLSQVSLQEYPPLARPDGRRLTVYSQPQKRLADLQGHRLVSCSPPCYRQPGRPLDLRQRKATPRLRQRRGSSPQAVARNRPRTEKAVPGEIAQRGRHDRLTECFSPTRALHHGRGQELRWQWEGRQKRALKHPDCGKTGLLTDRQEREPQRLVLASRSQAQAAEMLRLSKRRRPGLGWPASQWTDSTRSGQALSCFLALVLSRIVWLRLHERTLSVGGDLLTERLRGIHEALVV
jgi:hypothetical protein